ncbi:MarR family winged helix-turn-helix transcriptional regulator [Anoxynatronum sibiricum]|uniref:MarR family transcriptional regulator n=1 Tax=Anoxynatronum sibiricum TaxID=210623 RepID=A0ABU9VXZ0_9CLOT
MRHYYTQIHQYMERLISQVILTDRRELEVNGGRMNLQEYLLLKKVRRDEGQTFQQMMEETGCSRNEVTAMVRRLLKQQLIQKGPASRDRRIRRLVLTEEGKGWLLRMEGMEQELLYGLLNEFTFNEEKAILKFLVKLEMQLKEKDSAAALPSCQIDETN